MALCSMNVAMSTSAAHRLDALDQAAVRQSNGGSHFVS
jgi:hypothetical protein